jgi:hypothetical protein
MLLLPFVFPLPPMQYHNLREENIKATSHTAAFATFASPNPSLLRQALVTRPLGV